MKVHSILRVALVASFAVAAVPVHGAAPELKKATELLEKHYYESAALALRNAKPEAETEALAGLTLARAYARSAELHRALRATSLVLGARYLGRLAVQGGRDRSRYAALYYGEYLIEAGKAKEGGVQLRRFIEQKSLVAPYPDIARSLLAGAQGAVRAEQAKTADPLVRLETAVAMSRIAARRAEAVAIADQSLGELRKSGADLPIRAASGAIGIYARGDQHDKAFAALAAADLGRSSYEEKVSAIKVLRFYDPGLLGNLAELYSGAAEKLFMRARADTRLNGVAGYFLAELYLASGRAPKASTLLAELTAEQTLPPAFRERASILQAAADLKGAAFDELARKHAQDPVLLAETLLACVHARGRCAAVAVAARSLAQTSQSERFRTLHQAVGEHYAADGQGDLALQSLETARDKSNKNKIDTNDPLLLLHLAEQHFTAKSFSESLEIYFELGKEFPAVRQLQEAAQGIYSTEYRSAGDVKIF